jgi:hypothetical protein
MPNAQSGEVDIHELRKRHFAAYKRGKATLFVVRSQPHPPFPPFVFRKLDDEHLAILAWRNRSEAEKWCADSQKDSSRIAELPHVELQQLLNSLDPEVREGYKIEVI